MPIYLQIVDYLEHFIASGQVSSVGATYSCKYRWVAPTELNPLFANIFYIWLAPTEPESKGIAYSGF